MGVDQAVSQPPRKDRLAFLFLLDGALMAGSVWFLARYVAQVVPWLRSLPAIDGTILVLAAWPVALALSTVALGAYAAWGTGRAWRGEVSVHTRLAMAIGLAFGGFVVAGVALAIVVAGVAGVIVVIATLSS